MFLHKLLLVIFTFLAILSTLIISPQTHAAQASNAKMPFRNTEVWRQDPVAGGGYGVHKDTKGFAYDLYAPSTSTLDILAPTDGILGQGCTVNGATFLSVMSNEGDILRFMHIDANTVIINQGEFVRVKQGEVLGKITGAGKYESDKCKNSSDGPHLHFSWLSSMCNFNIDGTIFDCEGMRDCGSDEGLYIVPCNGKNPRSEFTSTNVAVEIPTNCEESINTKYNQGDYGLRIVKLQKCLTEKGLFNNPEGPTGFYGSYTDSVAKKAKTVTQPQAIVTSNPVSSGDDCGVALSTRYKFGETSERVKVLQRCLQAAGYFSFAGGITGYLGNYTKSAVEKYAQSQNNPQSPASTPQPASNNPCESILSQNYSIGQSGDNIKSLQQCLSDKGLYKNPKGITGYFGTYTSGVLAALHK